MYFDFSTIIIFKDKSCSTFIFRYKLFQFPTYQCKDFAFRNLSTIFKHHIWIALAYFRYVRIE